MIVRINYASHDRILVLYEVDGVRFRTKEYAKLAETRRAPYTPFPNGWVALRVYDPEERYLIIDPDNLRFVGKHSSLIYALSHAEKLAEEFEYAYLPAGWVLDRDGVLRHGDNYIQPDAGGNFHTPTGIFATLGDAYGDH